MNQKLKKVLSVTAISMALFSAVFSIQTPVSAKALSAADINSKQGFVESPHFEGPNGKFKVYLSPAAQPWNPYIDGSGSEEHYMRRVAQAMLPYLRNYGIEYVLAAQQTGSSSKQRYTLANRASQAKSTGCDLYLAIHSNAKNHITKGTQIYYYTKSSECKRFANVIASDYIYPDKNKIKLAYNNNLMEMYMPSMPHVLIETAFHDNYEDAHWIENNIDGIAQSLAKAVYDYSKGAKGGLPGGNSGSGLSLDRIMADIPCGTAVVLTPSDLNNGSRYDYGQVSWSSSNPNVASVDAYGTVIGQSRGTANIYAHVGGYTATCQVNIT